MESPNLTDTGRLWEVPIFDRVVDGVVLSSTNMWCCSKGMSHLDLALCRRYGIMDHGCVRRTKQNKRSNCVYYPRKRLLPYDLRKNLRKSSNLRNGPLAKIFFAKFGQTDPDICEDLRRMRRNGVDRTDPHGSRSCISASGYTIGRSQLLQLAWTL